MIMTSNFFETQCGNRFNVRLGSIVYENAGVAYRIAASGDTATLKIDPFGIISGHNVLCKQMLGSLHHACQIPLQTPTS